MLVNQHTIDPEMGCPGSLEGPEYLKRVRSLVDNKPFQIKPGDKSAFRVLVHHFVHNRDRDLIDACIELIICRGFYSSAYHPGNYTGVVCRAPEPCCSRSKLFIEFIHFFRKFHKKSSVFSVRKKDLMLLDSVLLVSRDTKEEELLEFKETSAEEIALILEYQQIRPIDEALNLTQGFNIEKLEDLEYFRRAQDIRDSNGVTRDPRAVPCFQTQEDIDALVEQLEQQNPIEFLVQAYALGLIDGRRLRAMYHTARGFDQLVNLLDRVGDVRALFEDKFTNREHSRMFLAAFAHIRRSEPSWFHSMLLFLIGTNVPDGWHLPRTDLETVPEEYLDMYLNYLLVYSFKCLAKPEPRIDDLELTTNLMKLPSIVDRLVERGASLTFAVHSHDAAKKLLYRYCPSILLASAYVEEPCPMFSSIGALLRLAQKQRELAFGDWLKNMCCSVKRLGPNEWARPIYDNTHLASLQCLAARAYILDRDITKLPVGLRAMILLHQDLKKVMKA